MRVLLWIRYGIPAIVLLALAGCTKAPAPTSEVVALSVHDVPLEPGDSTWEKAPQYVAKLLVQDLVDPRLTQPSTPEVRVQALTNGSEIAFRLRWADEEKDDMTEPGRFVDACAVQIPRTIDPNPPAPQMGETGRTVDITYWRADWQAEIEKPRDVRDLYPNASIDGYPFEAKSLEPGSSAQKEMAGLYAPAQALGNARNAQRQVPVECMVAEGPGTLSPAAGASAKGKGERTKDGWTVVLIRKMPDGLAGRARTQVAFAVWEGSRQEVGARKMRSGWVPLSIREAQ